MPALWATVLPRLWGPKGQPGPLSQPYGASDLPPMGLLPLLCEDLETALGPTALPMGPARATGLTISPLWGL